MSVRDRIIAKLDAAFAPSYLDVINESGSHNVPEGSESHFRVVVVADGFEDTLRVARHRAVHEALSEEIAGPVHALAIEAYTPKQWSDRAGQRQQSPDCRGGMALESR